MSTIKSKYYFSEMYFIAKVTFIIEENEITESRIVVAPNRESAEAKVEPFYLERYGVKPIKFTLNDTII